MADETTIYSAKHWAAKAAKSATAAAGSKADVAANATAAATSAQTASEKAEDAASSATSAAASATAAAGKATQAATSATNAGQSETAAAASATNAAASAQDAAQSAQNSRGLAIGQLVWSQSSLAKDNPGCLPAWTGEYYPNAAALYPDFYAWVKSHPELCKTKAQYDEALSAYGECPYYVADEVEGSLRLPKHKNSGRYLVKKEVNGNDWYALYSDGWLEQGGYFANPQTIGTTAITETFWKPYATPPTLLFGNMSTRHQAAYDSEHYPYNVTATGFTHENVQPIGQGTRWYAFGYAAATPMENIKYPWIVSFTAAVPASTAQAAEFTGALAGKANMDLSNVPNASKSALLDLLAKDTATWATLVNATDFVAPSAGWINYVPTNNADATIGINTGWSSCLVQLDGKTIINQCYCYGANGTNADAFAFFVGKGQTVKARFGVGTVYFYPCKGAK